MTADLIISGGRIIVEGNDGIRHADVAIRDGVFQTIAEPGTLIGNRNIDAAGKIVLPGAIDLHVHFRQPGFEYKEDFEHGTAAAACGGVTTVCDMPNTVPPVVDVAGLDAKRKLVENSAHVDFGLWAGGTNFTEIERMCDSGAIGLKVYMNRSHRSDDPYAEALSMPDLNTLGEVLILCRDLRMPVAVHVADPEVEAAQREHFRSISVSDPGLVIRSYRSHGVLTALREVLEIAGKTESPVHIAHASLAPTEAINIIQQARQAGVLVTSECNPPALLISDLGDRGVFGIPFAFSREDAAYYWRAIADGSIDIIATDHAPHSKADKDFGKTDVWRAPPGYPGVETSFPLMIDSAIRGVLSWSRLAEATSAGPAKIAQLSGKGGIRFGADADFVIVDPQSSRIVDESKLHSKAGWSPFHGRELRGRIESTYLRGEVIAVDGDLVHSSPAGAMLVPERKGKK